MLGTPVEPREQRVLSVERDRADGAFDGVVVEFDAAIVDEARQAFPARQGVTDSPRSLRIFADHLSETAQVTDAGRLTCARRGGRAQAGSAPPGVRWAFLLRTR